MANLPVFCWRTSAFSRIETYENCAQMKTNYVKKNIQKYANDTGYAFNMRVHS